MFTNCIFVGVLVVYILIYLPSVVPYILILNFGPDHELARALGNGPSKVSDFLITTLPFPGSSISSHESPVSSTVSETHPFSSSLQAPFMITCSLMLFVLDKIILTLMPQI